VRTGQEARELALNHPVEDALLGAAPCVAQLAVAFDLGMGRGGCASTHPGEALRGSYRARTASRRFSDVFPIETEAARSRPRCRRLFTS
jgi:hypothetical protein